MSLLSRFIRNKKNISSVLLSAQKDLFLTYGVKSPTDSQKLKAAVYFCIAGIALLNEMGNKKPELKPHIKLLIDGINTKSSELTENLSVRAGEICNNSEEIASIEFLFLPSEINSSTMLNGLAAYEALYTTKVFDDGVIEDILSHECGPFGPTGYAAIVVADSVFGKGASRAYMMELIVVINSFIAGIIETL